MFNLDLKRIRRIKKDIKNTNKRKAFTFDDKLILKISIPLILYMIIASVALFEFEQIALAFLFPFIGIGGSIIFTLNEIRIYLKEKNAEDNLNEVAEALEKVNVKTNVNNLSKCVPLPDIVVTDEDKNNKEYSSYCYMFLDDKHKLQGLLEKDYKLVKEYYLLENHELEEVKKFNVYQENLPKIKKLTRRVK